MKKKKMFKNKIQMFSYFILYALCLACFIIIGKANYYVEDQPEALKFSGLYNLVSDNNVYVFSNANKVLEILDGKSGIVLMGFPENKWTNYYAKILNDVCTEFRIDKIYYYNFLNDRNDNNGSYETLVNKLENYVPTNDLGVQNIVAPAIVIIKDGRIVGYFDDTANIHGNLSPEIYYTENQQAITYELLKTAIIEYLK